jgi:hypothetical protein
MKQPVFNGIENVKLNRLGGGKAIMTLDVGYFNPNKTGARLKSAEGEAWLDSTYLGHFFVDTSIYIPASSNFTIPVKLDMEMKNVLIHSLAAYKKQDLLVTIKGKAKVGKAGFYKRFSLDYEGKQNLSEVFNKIAPAR